MGLGPDRRGDHDPVAVSVSRYLGQLRAALWSLGDASPQPSGRRSLLAGVSLLNESRSELDLENLLGNDSRSALPWARFVDTHRRCRHFFSVRRDGPAKSDLVQWRARNSGIRLGGVGVRACAAALVARSSHSQKTAAGETRSMADSVPPIQRMPDVLFYDCRKAARRMETGQRRNLVSDNALGLVSFSKCRVVPHALGLLAGCARLASH